MESICNGSHVDVLSCWSGVMEQFFHHEGPPERPKSWWPAIWKSAPHHNIGETDWHLHLSIVLGTMVVRLWWLCPWLRLIALRMVLRISHGRRVVGRPTFRYNTNWKHYRTRNDPCKLPSALHGNDWLLQRATPFDRLRCNPVPRASKLSKFACDMQTLQSGGFGILHLAVGNNTYICFVVQYVNAKVRFRRCKEEMEANSDDAKPM